MDQVDLKIALPFILVCIVFAIVFVVTLMQSLGYNDKIKNSTDEKQKEEYKSSQNIFTIVSIVFGLLTLSMAISALQLFAPRD